MADGMLNKNEQDSFAKTLPIFSPPSPPEVRNLALAARGFVLEMIPNLTGMADAKARIIG
jgi:Domain of unknown function (DU1801)